MYPRGIGTLHQGDSFPFSSSKPLRNQSTFYIPTTREGDSQYSHRIFMEGNCIPISSPRACLRYPKQTPPGSEQQWTTRPQGINLDLRGWKENLFEFVL